jgi:hypothetical protein
MKTVKYLILSLFITLILACEDKVQPGQNITDEEQIEKHGDFFGEKAPGDSAVIFAPGFISTPLYTRDITFTPDGKEAYFCVSAQNYNLIFETLKDSKGKWSIPKPASFIEHFEYMYFEPFIDFDGKKMYFFSNMPDKDSIKGDEDIWYTERTSNGWSQPKNLGYPVNTEGSEFFPTLTKKGTLYFTRQQKGDENSYIFRSKQVNGKFQEPEKLPAEVNCGSARFNAMVSPDEDYIIVPAMGMTNNPGTDYYFVFNLGNNTWSEPVNAGNQMNSKARREFSASLSYNGKYVFFMSDRGSEEMTDFNLFDLVNKSASILNGNSNIYWVGVDFIENLRPKK